MKILKSVVSVLSLLGVWFLYYLWLPTLSVMYFDGFVFIAIAVLVVASNTAMWVSKEEVCWKMGKVALICLGAAVVLLILGGIIGSSICQSGVMYSQIGEVEKVQYDEMITEIDTAQIPIVDENLAKKQADKKIGEDVALGSRVTLGDAAIQEVNGEITFVAPLKHTGFFKWLENRTTPGYITVSASNPNKVQYVTEIGDQKIQVRYSPSAWFGDDLTRYVRNHGYRTVGLTEYTFELNDEGRPYWVITTFENKTLWRNGEATGVVIVDAQSGEIQWYALQDVPEWVDIIQPKKFIERQINHWGKLVHGAFNFSDKDKIEKTDLMLTVYVNGDCYYFTGMTSVGSDDSCVGFIMVNTRTKKAQMSYMSGATEPAAMKSAEGLVSDFGYYSTEPLPLNVNGVPTYAMALKDEEGLIKSYAMVNIENYSITAKGSSLQEASRAYIQAISRNSGIHVIASDEAYGYTYEGKVQRISSTVEDGSTYYYMVVEGEEGKIFMASYMVSDELSITRDGDTVKISYIDDKNGTVDVMEFDNVAFGTPKSEDQERRDEMDEGTSVTDSKYNQVVEVNPEMNEETWNSLSDEEKSKIIDELLGSKQN